MPILPSGSGPLKDRFQSRPPAKLCLRGLGNLDSGPFLEGDSSFLKPSHFTQYAPSPYQFLGNIKARPTLLIAISIAQIFTYRDTPTEIRRQSEQCQAVVTRGQLALQAIPEAEASRTPGAAVLEFLATGPMHHVEKQAGTATCFARLVLCYRRTFLLVVM